MASLNAFEIPVKSVTLYQSSAAEVLRVFSVDLKVGRNVVDIFRLSSSIEADSVRVTGTGDLARVLDVVYAVASGAPTAVQPASESLRGLVAQKRALEDEKDTQQHRLELLSSYLRSLTVAQVPPGDVVSLFDDIIEVRRVVMSTIRQIEEQIVDIERAIDDERVPRPHIGATTGHATVVIAASQECSVEMKLTYLVTDVSWKPFYELYVTTENGQPAKSVTLHRRAHIVQRTGEDWRDAALTLCTSPAPAHCTSNIPDVGERKIVVVETSSSEPSDPPVKSAFTGPSGFFQPAPATQSRFSTQSVFPQINSAPLAPRGLSASQRMAAPPAPLPEAAFNHSSLLTGHHGCSGIIFGNHASQKQSVFDVAPRYALFGSPSTIPSNGSMFPAVQDTRQSAEQAATGDASAATTVKALGTSVHSETLDVPADGAPPVPSDGLPHAVSLSVATLKAEFAWVCVPDARAAAYVECRMTNDGAAAVRLLAGPVNAYIDDEFVAKGELKDVPSGGSFACSLGADNAVEVSYSRTMRQGPEPPRFGAFGTVAGPERTHCADLTTVVNRHMFAIALLVRHAVPATSDLRLTVSADSVLVTLSGGDDGHGEKNKYWERRYEVEAGRSVVCSFGWEVSAPAGITWKEEDE